MTRSSIFAALALPLFAMACESTPATTGTTGGAATTKAATTAAGTGAKATSTAATTAAAATATAASTAAAAGTSSADAFPAQPLTAKDFADYTINVPTGGKINSDKIETPDYKLIIKKAKEKENIAELKGLIQKMPGFKAITVDKEDGLVVETEEKGAKQYVITRHVKIGDVTLTCETTLTGPAKDEAKAKEAWDVCGTLKKKS